MEEDLCKMALGFANEINKLETNLRRMSPDTSGYRQLTYIVRSMKDVLTQYGFEMVDLYGTRYTDGMKAEADFVPLDESGAEEKWTIVGVTRPQVNYNGKMIQSPHVTVAL